MHSSLLAPIVGAMPEERRITELDDSDTLVHSSKADLFARYSALRDEEQQLGSQTRGTRIDEAVLLAHIDRVSKVRAELEKANAHMLLQLRQELTPDQVATLDAHRTAPPPPH